MMNECLLHSRMKLNYVRSFIQMTSTTAFCILQSLESFYIFYMYNMFRTSYSFNHPLELFIQKNHSFGDLLTHPIYTSRYENKICRLGKYASIGLVIWIWLRAYIVPRNTRWILNYIVFGLMLICTLVMNMNAFVYLVPIYIYEFAYPWLNLDVSVS